MVWGRRRVGQTALLQRFVDDKPVVFHAAPIGGRSTSYACCSSRWPSHSLRACATPPSGRTRPGTTPWTISPPEPPIHQRCWCSTSSRSWFAPRVPARHAACLSGPLPRPHAAAPAPLRIGGAPHAGPPGGAPTALRSLRSDPRRPPLRPARSRAHARTLERLDPADRAVVYGVVGGMPLYLSWWDQDETIDENLARLVCEPGARLSSTCIRRSQARTNGPPTRLVVKATNALRQSSAISPGHATRRVPVGLALKRVVCVAGASSQLHECQSIR